MRAKHLLPVVPVVLAAGLAVAAPAAEAATAPAPAAKPLTCDAAPTTATYLTADLTCPAPLWLRDTSVKGPFVMDLRGHTLTIQAPGQCANGPGYPTCGLAGPYDIRNGTLRGGVAGLSALRNVTVTGGVIAGGTFAAPYFAEGRSLVTISKSRILDQQLVVQGPAVVEDSSFQRAGIRTIESLNPVTLTARRNTIMDAPGAGMDLATRVPNPGALRLDIRSNTIRRSGGPGLLLGGSQVLAASTVADNLVTHNAGDGIRLTHTNPMVDGYGRVTLTGNTATDNAGQGIAAPADPTRIIDGGDNVAAHNRTKPPCTGVVCRPRR